MLKLNWKQVAAWRVRRHHLDQRMPAGSMLAVASRLCGLHAQVLSSAGLMLWARTEGTDRLTIHRALWEERTLVKTWAMRGTLHLLPAAELPLWHAALSINPRYLRPAIWKRFGLTIDELDELTEAIGVALDGCAMTREELAQKVGQITGSAKLGKKLAFGSWGTILKPAAFTGRLCFAPSVGQHVRFTRPQSWLSLARSSGDADVEVAMAAVTRRFLTAYGPATYADLARWWGGGGIASARRCIAALGEEVTQLDLDGAQAWMLAADAREARELPPRRTVRLVPAFDQYVIGASRHAEPLLPNGQRSDVYRPQGWISPVLLVNGLMQGVWRHEIKGSGIEVVIKPFGNAPSWVRKAAVQEAERLAEFLGGKLKLAWKN